jgi:hypothetical protein
MLSSGQRFQSKEERDLVIQLVRKPVTLFLILAAGLLGRQGGDLGLILSGARRKEIDIRLEASPLRAAVHLSYRRKGMGEVRIAHHGASAVRGLRLEVEIPGRTDLLPEPFTAEVPEIAAGGSAKVLVCPRFAPAILDLKTTELPFRAVVRNEEGLEIGETTTLVPVIERRLVTWDVPERVAALIDPEPLIALVREALAAGAAAKRSGDLAIPNLRAGAGAFDALAAWGLRYLEDAPAAAAGALLGVPADRVNDPAETLREHGGDCDDLSVLLAAALEAAGVPSALGISESHVFVLLDTGLETLSGSALDPSWVLERGGRAWMPVEATCLARGGSTLLSAAGNARGRLPALRSGAARFFETRKAWSDYPALAAPPRGESAAPGAPAAGCPTGQEAPTASERELSGVLRSAAARKAEEARGRGDGDPGEGDRRAAAEFSACGYHLEAADLLRRALARKAEPGTRLELAGEILADPRGADLAEARRELRLALGELDPLDIGSRSEALKRMEEASLLLGDLRGARDAAAAAADPLASVLALGPQPAADGKGGL